MAALILDLKTLFAGSYVMARIRGDLGLTISSIGPDDKSHFGYKKKAPTAMRTFPQDGNLTQKSFKVTHDTTTLASTCFSHFIKSCLLSSTA